MLDSQSKSTSPWRFCTAPMMDWSDRHCRYFWRLLTKHTRLYTEMVTSGALIHGDRQRFLRFAKEEHPIALQLGGSSPEALAQCATIAEHANFDEVNLNCGCPSDRVQEGKIGACLMAEPALVADCVSAMIEATALPVTVKHRLGIDDLDTQEHLLKFAEQVINAGCKTLIIHARKAWLKGLSPKQNREVPPLEYQRVFEVKQQFPDITIVVNGGIDTLEHSQELLQHVDGVMIGREAYHNPFVLQQVDNLLFGEPENNATRYDVLNAFRDYCVSELKQGTRLHHITRHILGIFAAQPGGRLFRQHLSLHANKRDAGINVLDDAIAIQKRAFQQAQQQSQ